MIARYELDKTDKAILTIINKGELATDITGKYIDDDLLEIKFGEQRMPQVRLSIDKLMKYDLIELAEDEDDIYRLTPYGEQEARNIQNYVNNIGNITNSNIAINSSNIIQKLDITDKDMKRMIKDLEKAVNDKNASKIKKAFGYIADKSVDIAIGLLINGLMK